MRDHVGHRRVRYLAKDFDEQCSYRFTLEFRNASRARPLVAEVGVYLHWKRSSPVDVAVDLSCASGCTEDCVFCSAAHLTPLAFTAEQIVEQAVVALAEIRGHEREFFGSFGDKPLITFSFEGMGEPSRYASEIARAMDLLDETFGGDFQTQFIISTTAANPAGLSLWADKGLQSLQVSLHASNDDTRRALLGDRAVSLAEVLGAVDEFHTSSPDTQIKLNYLLLENENDSDEAAEELCDLIGSRPYFIKIARLNETVPAVSASLRRPGNDRIARFARLVAARRPEGLTYRYGSDREIQISCGQLATYAEPSRLDADTARSIRQIYNSIFEGRAILFLGAGASSSLPQGWALGRRLYQLLDYKTPYEESGLGLRETADLLRAQNKANVLIDELRKIIAHASCPPEFLWLTMFPWRAIYTTNYDRFLEEAFDQARAKGLTELSCQPIISSSDLTLPVARDTIPIYKLHGCISRPEELVLTGTDYLLDYRERHEALFNVLKVDALRNDTVFAGYSFRDDSLASLIAHLKRSAKDPTASFAVMPSSERTQDQQVSLRETFATRLLSMTFKEFVEELVTEARKLTVYVAGSNKPRIGSDGSSRRDFGDEIAQFARALGNGLTREGIRMVNGASARDKVGYLVARHMDESLVTTYQWHGVDQIDDMRVGDELEPMINVREFGTKVSDVIDEMARVAQVSIFVGGGRITLKEFFRVSGRGRLVIPIALGDTEYASDVIHQFLSQNATAINRFSSDESSALKEPRRTDFQLEPHHLDALKLGKSSAGEVANAVLEILREYRLTMREADLGATES